METAVAGAAAYWGRLAWARPIWRWGFCRRWWRNGAPRGFSTTIATCLKQVQNSYNHQVSATELEILAAGL